MKNLVVFVPRGFDKEKSGYLFGKVVYDANNDVKKFYVIGVHKTNFTDANKFANDLIGYYSNAKDVPEYTDKRYSDWIHIHKSPENVGSSDYSYCVKHIILGSRRIPLTFCHTVIIVYDKVALQKTEMFATKTLPPSHFLELIKIVQDALVKDEIQRKSKLKRVKEILLTYYMFVYFYPILFLTKITNYLLPILKYSSLGLHINNWLENMKWMLITVIHSKKFSLKAGNYVLALLVDMTLGILVLQLLVYIVGDMSPSDILLNNAEKVVNFLKSLINWLMGAPAGLKLNYAFNNMLGKFFLYHIQLWWAFLIFTKPLMDFAFKVFFLFGKLGITFQICIAADLLALVSVHIYCIYVYAARLFNIQLRGLIALFRLFLGKKNNPLRERIDSCNYQAEQLFVGTLLFTILLFLMPTTWVYYTVFMMLRLVLIAFGGILTRLRFYLQVVPMYAFLKWLFHAHNTCGTIDISLHSHNKDGSIILLMSLVVSPWLEIWKNCVPDTIASPPSITWGSILQNILLGKLLYPL